MHRNRVDSQSMPVNHMEIDGNDRASELVEGLSSALQRLREARMSDDHGPAAPVWLGEGHTTEEIRIALQVLGIEVDEKPFETMPNFLLKSDKDELSAQLRKLTVDLSIGDDPNLRYIVYKTSNPNVIYTVTQIRKPESDEFTDMYQGLGVVSSRWVRDILGSTIEG